MYIPFEGNSTSREIY
jgi:hypothetical protein